MAAWESSSELNLASEERIKKTANDKQRGREMRVMKFLFRKRQRKLNGIELTVVDVPAVVTPLRGD